MPTTSFRPRLEILECREVPAATLLNQGTLYVTGTDQADIIRVSVPATDTTKVQVAITSAGQSTVQSFDRSLVENLVIRGKAGSDYIRNDTDLRSAIFGGKGNDTIWGGSQADLLVGNEGDDRLYGQNGNDILDGGIGDDELSGMNGIDVLIGRLGNDKLDGGNGADRIAGGLGNDIITGGNGRDVLYDRLGTDTVIGPIGEDIRKTGLKNEVALQHISDEIVSSLEKLERLPGRVSAVLARAGVLVNKLN